MSITGQNNTHNCENVITELVNMPLVDAHMHIQSNDIAPIPIMQGVAYLNIGARNVKSELEKQKKINYYELSFRNMDNFPSPDDISPNSSTRVSVFGNIIKSLARNRRFITNRVADIGSVVTNAYGRIARHTTLNIAGIYMKKEMTNSMGYSSRRSINIRGVNKDPTRNYTENRGSVSSGESDRRRLIEDRTGRFGQYQRVVTGYYGDNIEGVFEFSIVLGMELMYAHYWGAYGIPIYIYVDDNSNDNKLFYVSNDLSYTPRRDRSMNKEVCHTAYDIERKALWENYSIVDKNGNLINEVRNRNNIDFFNEPPARIELGNGYKHYLVPVNTEEVVQYEDFKQHLEYTEMAAIKFPFSLLPFYHFDPRRFLTPDINPSLHEFYRPMQGNRLTLMDTNEIMRNINTGFPFKYKYTIDELKNKLLSGTSDRGLFWGIKMYAALGYPPYLENYQEITRVFPQYDASKRNIYNGLTAFYDYCADNDIPVTCHCSPRGMTIADSGVYLKEYLKQQHGSIYHRNQKVNFPVGAKQFIQGLGLLDDFSSPDSWRRALEMMGSKAQRFRLCLAHYGGRKFLSGELYDTNDSPYCWYREISSLINDYDQVYTDLSCYTIKDIPDFKVTITQAECNRYKSRFPVIEEIYQHISDPRSRTQIYRLRSNYQARTEDEKVQILALRLEMIEDNKESVLYKEVSNIAARLETEIDRIPKLQYRIMFGTDWPMSEMDVTGVTDYKASMFIILQLLTKRLGGKWDAWHQFTVINPLRFMGLIDEDANESAVEELDFKFDKLTAYNERLINYLDAIELESEDMDYYEDKYDLKKDNAMSDINRKYRELREKYETAKIPTASSKYLRKDNLADSRLKILGDEK